MNEDVLLQKGSIVPLNQEIIQEACTTRFPTPIAKELPFLSNSDKIDLIADKFRDIMKILGLDVTDDSLQHTPKRVAKMYVEEVFSGLDQSTFPEMSYFEDHFQSGEQSNMVFVKVNFCSFCEHHFVPMIGTACVAYLPKGTLIGLSNISRIVRFFAKRPQLQERLTAQIADAMSILTGSEHVAVSLKAEHHCMIVRGIENENSFAITNALRGDFNGDTALGKEFFNTMNAQSTKWT